MSKRCQRAVYNQIQKSQASNVKESKRKSSCLQSLVDKRSLRAALQNKRLKSNSKILSADVDSSGEHDGNNVDNQDFTDWNNTVFSYDDNIQSITGDHHDDDDDDDDDDSDSIVRQATTSPIEDDDAELDEIHSDNGQDNDDDRSDLDNRSEAESLEEEEFVAAASTARSHTTHANSDVLTDLQVEQQLREMFDGCGDMSEFRQHILNATNRCLNGEESSGKSTFSNEPLELFPDPDAALKNANLPSTAKRKSSSVGEFCRDYISVCAQLKVAKSASEELLRCWYRHTTGLNLPLQYNENSENLMCKLFDLKASDPKNIIIDGCSEGHMLFIGDHSEKLYCDDCQKNRYYDCTYNYCHDKHNDICDSFRDPTRLSHHATRRSIKKMFYRPLTAKFMEMYQTSITTDKTIFTFDHTRFKKDGYITDVMDGLVVKSHLRHMHEIYTERAQQYIVDHPGCLLFECSLIFSLFYDGNQLYDRNCASLWPLFASVWNCNPSYRTKLGLGMFMNAIHDFDMGSMAEQQFIDGILSEELEMLEDGMIFNMKDAQGRDHAVFLQARCLYLHLDTKAFEKGLHMQCANAMYGCGLCDGKIKGISRALLKKRINFGQTIFLPDNHTYKNEVFAEHGNLAPPDGYYGESVTSNKLYGKTVSREANEVHVETFTETEHQTRDPRHSIGLNLHPPRNKKNMNKTNLRWFNSKFPFKLFEDAVWCAYRDNRPHSRFTRTKHASYIRNGLAAIKAGDVVNGVHTLSKWCLLKYGLKIEYQCYDIMHSVALITRYMFKSMKGTRGMSVASRRLSLRNKRFPFLKQKKITPGWILSMAASKRADSAHHCIVIPAAYATNYKFQFPFKHTGHMNSHHKMVFMRTFVNFALSFTDLTSSYKAYYARFSNDLCLMTNPVIETQSLLNDRLFNMVLETNVTHEMIFPDSEQQFIFHEILEIVNHIQGFGPPKELSCFSGERAMKTISDAAPTGGTSILNTVEERCVAKEHSYGLQTEQYVKNMELFTDNKGNYSPICLKLSGKESHLMLNVVNKDMLAQRIVDFLGSQETDNLPLNSNFSRVWLIHSQLKIRQNIAKSEINHVDTVLQIPASFFTWILQLSSVYVANLERLRMHHLRHLVCDVIWAENHPSVGLDRNDANSVHSAAVMLDAQIDQGVIYLSDFKGIIQELALFGTKQNPLCTVNKAVIKGIQFIGRGIECAEHGVKYDRNLGNNSNRAGFRTLQLKECNKIKQNWYKSVGSWCSVNDAIMDGGEWPTHKKYMAQLNYFFRLRFQNDSVLHGLAFANAVCRTVIRDNHRHHYYIGNDDSRSYKSSLQFVALNYVESTSIAVCAFDSTGLPIISRKTNASWTRDRLWGRYSVDCALDRLYFIELHPERLIKNLRVARQRTTLTDLDGGMEEDFTNTTDYCTIDKDEDGTKVFEKMSLE